jgi:hypothetical protein
MASVLINDMIVGSQIIFVSQTKARWGLEKKHEK